MLKTKAELPLKSTKPLIMILPIKYFEKKYLNFLSVFNIIPMGNYKYQPKIYHKTICDGPWDIESKVLLESSHGTIVPRKKEESYR